MAAAHCSQRIWFLDLRGALVPQAQVINPVGLGIIMLPALLAFRPSVLRYWVAAVFRLTCTKSLGCNDQTKQVRSALDGIPARSFRRLAVVQVYDCVQEPSKRVLSRRILHQLHRNRWINRIAQFLARHAASSINSTACLIRANVARCGTL